MFVQHPIHRCYLIFDTGEVVSLKYGKWRVLRPFATGKHRKYLAVDLTVDAKRKTYKVHHMVAEAFLGLRREGFVVDHVDGNSLNNHVSNLEYVTVSENVKRGYALTKRPGNRRKLSEADVQYIRSLKGTMSGTNAAKLVGINMYYLYDIWSGVARSNGRGA